MNATMPTEADVERFREQIRKIASSEEFATTRQIRSFLQYSSEAAFEGRDHLDQIEIAESVLNRPKDFNPLDDASVRKLATMLRQRLERYYQTAGLGDDVIVTLPPRSYVVQFAARKPEESRTVVESIPAAAPTHAPAAKHLAFWVYAAIFAVAGVAGIAYFRAARAEPAPEGVFRLSTQAGDIMHKRNDPAPGAIRLGPALGERDDVTALMRFTPEQALQQAGLLIYQSADHYIKFGRQFSSRCFWEFGIEVNGAYRKSAQTFQFDPSCQNGEPVWLSIRRQASLFRAYISSNGSEWRQIGEDIISPEPLPQARLGVYAHTGRSQAKAVPAEFSRLSFGPAFHSIPDDMPIAEALPGWRLNPGANSGAPPRLFGGFLEIRFAPVGSFSLLRPAPKGDWDFSTWIDLQAANGSAAGLVARGEKSFVRLIRWDLAGGSVTLEHLGHRQASAPDFDGSPPLTLRLRARNGILEGAFSRDDKTFRDLDLRVPLQDLGAKIEVGVIAATSTWWKEGSTPTARFANLQWDVLRLE
jgi:regulation of enolase protein 1 (concanavalin A-like superfamily)